MTPRGTDWTLASLVAVLFTTGILTLLSGRSSETWVFVLHGVGGLALVLVTGVKLRRVWPRLVHPRHWDRATVIGLLATLCVITTLLSGGIWSSGGDLYVLDFNLINWHIVLGVVLTALVTLHAWRRAKPLRTRDVQGRRQVLLVSSMATGAAAIWFLQRPLSARLGWRGARRRWTGSYERASFTGNGFPATSWVADQPRPLLADSYRLAIDGLVARPITLALDGLPQNDSWEATLDCTGGFYTTQRWHGVQLQRLLDQAGVLPEATHLKVVSHTGYRWSFPISEASQMLLATHVGDEPLTHGHGGPVRLVAPLRRGFQWVKWVVRIEAAYGPDLGAAASTIWSSWTAAGRGET